MNGSDRSRAVQLLEDIRELMGLKGENPFKVRAFEKAKGILEALPESDDLKSRARDGRLTELPGIGKGISEVLTEYLLHGRSTALDDLKKSIPPAIFELTRIPGLGPKKAQMVIDELGVETLGELEYACRENRLLKLSGFGDKLQAKILEGIQFLKKGEGQKRIDEAFAEGEQVFKLLYKAANQGRHPAAESWRVSEAGALRRRCEVLSELDFLIELPPGELAAAEIRRNAEDVVSSFKASFQGALPVRTHYSRTDRYGYELARLTGTPAHWNAVGNPEPFDAPTEEEFFKRLGLPLLPPETRETGEEVILGRSGKISHLLPWDGIRGVFHNHTTRSDGISTLEEMVSEAEALGLEYIGISDHSQSAFYAQGLKVPDLLDQEREIKEVQARHPGIRVFWGIESDILADGSLDYDEEILKKFDFVVASIHSRFQMDSETMTARILEAVKNPRTRFLGHATGRILLGRPGYECDMEKIIRAAADHGVAIEINANPARLDIDWRWGKALRSCGAQVSVNPDAHSVSGLSDTHFGVAVARKALLSTDSVINTRPAAEVESWLERQG